MKYVFINDIFYVISFFPSGLTHVIATLFISPILAFASASLRKEWMLSSSSLTLATFLWIPSNSDASWDNNRIKCCITSLTALSAISLPLIDLTTRLWARPLIWLQMIEWFYSLNCLKEYWSTNKGGIEMGLDSMSGCVLERVWMSRTCRRRRRSGKVMVLFLGNVDFEVVVSLMMLVLVLKKRKEIVGLGFHELRGEMLMMIWRDRLKNVNCTGLEKWVWQWW